MSRSSRCQPYDLRVGPSDSASAADELRAEHSRAHISWEASADSYDQSAGHGRVSPVQWRVWSHLLARLLPTDRRRVLDIGTGTGLFALLAAELGHEVTAIDFSERMLAIARRSAVQRGLEVTFQCGDAYDPGLNGAMFDAVISRHVLWTLLRPEQAVQQWGRLAVPGGQIIAVDGFFTDVTVLDGGARLLGEFLQAARSRRWQRMPHSNPSLPLRWATTLAPVRNVFERAGLEQVRTEMLEGVDRIERAAMTLEERLRYRWRRFLVEGTVPDERVRR